MNNPKKITDQVLQKTWLSTAPNEEMYIIRLIIKGSKAKFYNSSLPKGILM